MRAEGHCRRIHVTQKPPWFECQKCDWKGTSPSTTEFDYLNDDGFKVRGWEYICPKCFTTRLEKAK